MIRSYLADTLSTGVDVMASNKATLTACAQGKVPVAERTAIALLSREPLFTHTLTWKYTCITPQETEPKANMTHEWKVNGKTTTSDATRLMMKHRMKDFETAFSISA